MFYKMNDVFVKAKTFDAAYKIYLNYVETHYITESTRKAFLEAARNKTVKYNRGEITTFLNKTFDDAEEIFRKVHKSPVRVSVFEGRHLRFFINRFEFICFEFKEFAKDVYGLNVYHAASSDGKEVITKGKLSESLSIFAETQVDPDDIRSILFTFIADAMEDCLF